MAVNVVIVGHWVQSANYTACKPSTALVMVLWNSHLEKEESTPNNIKVLHVLL